MALDEDYHGLKIRAISLATRMENLCGHCKDRKFFHARNNKDQLVVLIGEVQFWLSDVRKSTTIYTTQFDPELTKIIASAETIHDTIKKREAVAAKLFDVLRVLAVMVDTLSAALGGPKVAEPFVSAVGDMYSSHTSPPRVSTDTTRHDVIGGIKAEHLARLPPTADIEVVRVRATGELDLRVSAYHAAHIECKVVAYFYDYTGNALEARGSRHSDPTGLLCSSMSLIPDTAYAIESMTLSLPVAELSAVTDPSTSRFIVRAFRSDPWSKIGESQGGFLPRLRV